MHFYLPFNFFNSFSIFFLLQKQHFASLERIGVPPKEEKCHFSFFLIKRHFCMYFYVPFNFFNSFSIFLSLQKQHFASLERIGVPPKEKKGHFSFFLIKRHFCIYFYLPFHFFKLFFNFPFIAKAAICKSRAHRGTPRGGKMSHLFFSNKTAFLQVFLRAISFFQSLFQFYFHCKSSILQV